MSISEDIKNMYTMAPIWEPGVWTAIQNRDYQGVEIRIRAFLESQLTENEWKGVYWRGILKGSPSFRGNLQQSEWDQGVLPAIMRAVRSVASDEILAAVYSTLHAEDLKKFRALMLSVVSEADAKLHTPRVATDGIQQTPDQPRSQTTVQQNNHEAVVTKEDSGNLLSPAFRPGTTTPQSTLQEVEHAPPQGSAPAPFIIHEETEIQPTASRGIAPLDRPQFFKSTVEEKPYVAPATARLEIGEEVVSPPQSQQVGHTKREEPRVVNYTAPVVQADPFVRPPQDKKPAEEKPTHEDVSPENIINLRDLPK